MVHKAKVLYNIIPQNNFLGASAFGSLIGLQFPAVGSTTPRPWRARYLPSSGLAYGGVLLYSKT
jgi:hypothetical protein